MSNTYPFWCAQGASRIAVGWMVGWVAWPSRPRDCCVPLLPGVLYLELPLLGEAPGGRSWTFQSQWWKILLAGCSKKWVISYVINPRNTPFIRRSYAIYSPFTPHLSDVGRRWNFKYVLFSPRKFGVDSQSDEHMFLDVGWNHQAVTSWKFNSEMWSLKFGPSQKEAGKRLPTIIFSFREL